MTEWRLLSWEIVEGNGWTNGQRDFLELKKLLLSFGADGFPIKADGELEVH